METFSALLAICAGNSMVTGEFPAQRPVPRSFGVFFDWINGWVNNREAGDLRRHRTHHDVTIMMNLLQKCLQFIPPNNLLLLLADLIDLIKVNPAYLVHKPKDQSWNLFSRKPVLCPRIALTLTGKEANCLRLPCLLLLPFCWFHTRISLDHHLFRKSNKFSTLATGYVAVTLNVQFSNTL